MKINTKWAVAIILILLPAVVAIAGGKPDDPGPGNQQADEFAASDVGGGGWMHSGTFHPLDSDVILIGSDMTGEIFRTDDSGESWYPWNEGLPNYDNMSRYVEDLIGVVEPDGTVVFYAATHGGICRAPDDGPWDWMGDNQPRDENGEMDPAQSLIYWRVNGDQFDDNRWHREPISFSCLDWNGENLLVAGAGRVRWNTTYETTNYPGIQQDELISGTDCPLDDPDTNYPCNPQLHPVWIHDLEHPENGWQPLDTPEGFGTPRDISVTEIDGNNYLAVATHTGIYFYDFAAAQWHDMTDNYFYHDTLGPDSRPIDYGSELTAWSIHLTKRGTLFAAMQRVGGLDFPSGVYRVYNAPALPEMPWVWVGDDEAIYPHATSLWNIGLGGHYYGQPDLIYLTVVDGDGEDPDTLYLGDRAKPFGLFKGEQPLDFTGGQGLIPGNWSVSLTAVSWNYWYPYGNDKGWLDFFGPQVIFHPIVMPGSSPDKLAIHFNGRMHVSDDGGSTWDQRYCEEDPEEDGVWSSRGFNEHCIIGATFLGDGRPVFSAGDTGSFVSTDVEGSAFEYIHPEILWDHDPTDNKIRDTESNSVHVLLEWEGDTEQEKRDALFINYSDMFQKLWYGKLFMHLYDREEGVSNEPTAWFNITKSLPDLDHYLFGDFAFIDYKTCLLSYLHYTGQVGQSGSESDGYGVFKGVFVGYDEYNEPVWTWTDWSAELPIADGSSTYVTSILHNSYRGDRIFLTTARTKDVGGGLFMLEPADSDTWQSIYEGDYLDGDDDDLGVYRERYRDFRSLAQSDDGSWLYVGTRGSSSGFGGLLLCRNTSRAADVGELDESGYLPVVLEEWEILANDPDNEIRPFEFYLNLPFWYEDFLHWGDPDSIDKKMTYIASLAVDPRDRKVVYVGLRDQGMSSRSGLWRYDGRNWEHLSPDQPFKGMGIAVLEFNPYVPGQLLVGTGGQGLYIGEVGED